jgi:hypothetical protein
MHDLNTIVNNGEIHGVFTKEEYEAIVTHPLMRMAENKDQAAGNRIRGVGRQKDNNQLILS